jgi:regulator of Ty1 transposition protein 109
LDPETRPSIGGGVEKIWVHVFARAQNQYLFPNSSEYGGKKPLSDIRLCGWWKAILSAVATDLKQKACEEGTLKLWYTLPGLTDLEASRALNSVSGPSTSRPTAYEISWNYGHPYSQAASADHSDVIQLPCPVDSKTLADGRQNLGNFIPSFEDDPKSRFLDEIAHTSESDAIRSPVRKKSKKGLNEEAGEKKKEVHEFAELMRVTPDEFWERMSFRQECVAGVVTGFFVLAYSTRSKQNVDSASTTSSVSIFAPQPYHVSSNITKRVLTSLITGHEFSTVERAIRGTETLEGAIKGLCEGINSHETGPPPAQDQGRKTPDPADRPSLLDLPPRTPPRNVKAKGLPAEVSPNPFPEPVASLETYYSWIYGSVCVDNPTASVESVRTDTGSAGAPVSKEQKVTVLTVRKKKRTLE